MVDDPTSFESSQSSSSSFHELLTSSSVSLVLGVLAGLILFVGTLYVTMFAGTEVELFTNRAIEELRFQPLGTQIEEISYEINDSETAATLAIFVFWAITGLLLFTFVSAIIHGFKVSEEMVESVWYTSKNGRWRVVEGTATRTLVRLLGVLGVYVAYRVVLFFIPFAIAWMSEVRLMQSWPLAILTALLMSIVGYLFVYLVTLLLRMITLRTRVFLT